MTRKFVNVWRLETPEGEGVFQAGYACDAYHEIEARDPFGRLDPRRHPSPHDSPALKLAIQRGYAFGFAKLSTYRLWFADATMRRFLGTDTPILLRKYRVPADAVIKGPLQVAFDCSQAALVEDRSPSYRD